jgi:hypothetical protein
LTNLANLLASSVSSSEAHHKHGYPTAFLIWSSASPCLDRLSREFPQTEVQTGVRWVDEGDLVTSAGIEAGIDMSLHLIERLLGRETAETTAKRMEYSWQENQR